MILTAATGPYFAKNMPRLSSDIAVGRFDYDPDQHPSTTHPREHSRRIDYSSNTTNQHTAQPLTRGILTSGSPKSCDPLAFSHATRVEQVRYTRPTRHYGYVMICRYEPARADTELPSSTRREREILDSRVEAEFGAGWRRKTYSLRPSRTFLPGSAVPYSPRQSQSVVPSRTGKGVRDHTPLDLFKEGIHCTFPLGFRF